MPSLEKAVAHFLRKAEDAASEAQVRAEKIALDIEDLEAEESVESLLVKAVTGEDSKDRNDREIVMPALKFLWETYKLALDILRNNNKLEVLYNVTQSKKAIHLTTIFFFPKKKENCNSCV